MKFKNPTTKDIPFSFDYYNKNRDIKRYCLNSERNLVTNRYKYKNITLITKTEKDNNFEIYKETKSVNIIRVLFYEALIYEDAIYISFPINIILILIKIIYDKKRREEKRREKIVSRGGAPK